MPDALWIALALVAVIEGIAPMLLPHRWKTYLQQIAAVPANQLRTIGGTMVTIGVVSLFFLL